MKRCSCCGGEHDGPRAKCQACTARASRKRLEKIARGECDYPTCHAPPRPGKRTCARCAAYKAANKRKRRSEQPPPPPPSIVSLLNDYDAIL